MSTTTRLVSIALLWILVLFGTLAFIQVRLHTLSLSQPFCLFLNPGLSLSLSLFYFFPHKRKFFLNCWVMLRTGCIFVIPAALIFFFKNQNRLSDAAVSSDPKLVNNEFDQVNRRKRYTLIALFGLCSNKSVNL